MTLLSRDFFARDVLAVARDLIGAKLLVSGVGGLIVETEAYASHDPASHSFSGATARNAAMFGPSGHSYVYRSYGIHWCLNFVCEPGSAVLVRALHPIQGIEIMQERRGVRDDRLLCAGPGRLCQALGVSIAHNGLRLDAPPFSVWEPTGTFAVDEGARIGISKAVDLPWRFVHRGSRYVSRKVPSAPGRAGP